MEQIKRRCDPESAHCRKELPLVSTDAVASLASPFGRDSFPAGKLETSCSVHVFQEPRGLSWQGQAPYSQRCALSGHPPHLIRWVFHSKGEIEEDRESVPRHESVLGQP